MREELVLKHAVSARTFIQTRQDKLHYLVIPYGE